MIRKSEDRQRYRGGRSEMIVIGTHVCAPLVVVDRIPTIDIGISDPTP